MQQCTRETEKKQYWKKAQKSIHAMHSRLFYVWHSFEYSRISMCLSLSACVCVCVCVARVYALQRVYACISSPYPACWYGSRIVVGCVTGDVWLSLSWLCLQCTWSIVCAWTRYSYVHYTVYTARTWFCFVHAVDTAVGYHVTAIRLCSCCCCLMRETLTRARPQ